MTELTLWLKTKSSFRQTVSLQKQQKELQKNFQKKIFSGIERDDSEIFKTTILGIKTKENCKE